jgi:hypothetical protein
MTKRNTWSALILALVVSIATHVLFSPVGPALAASDQGFNGTIVNTASFTVTAEQNGSVFTNRGDNGSQTITLPAPFANAHYIFLVHTAQSMVVTAATADTLIVYNDDAADSIASNTVGAMIWVWSDGTSFFAIGVTVGVTYTVVTN